eukprot:8256542-Lingulodinium_polyedra.AAC.1
MQPGLDDLVAAQARDENRQLDFQHAMLTVHVDDFTTELVEEDTAALVESLGSWAGALARLLDERLKLPRSVPKMALVTTSEDVARRA